MPRADNLPNITVATENTLCTHNPLGSKGCGEVGAIGSPPAVINAVVDALKDYGVRHIDMPATGAKIWSIIQAGRPAHGRGIRQAKGKLTMYDFAYQKPGSLADAVKVLRGDPEPRRWPAGMTFIPVLKQRLNKPSTVVDLAKLGLSGITVDRQHGHDRRDDDARGDRGQRRDQGEDPGPGRIGVAIGDEAVRHRGTMGGSLANNDPAACYPPRRWRWAATIKTDRRTIAADEFFQGMFTTALGARRDHHRDRAADPAKVGLREVPQPGLALRHRGRVRRQVRRKACACDDRRRAERRVPPRRDGERRCRPIFPGCDRRDHDAGRRAERRHPRQRRVSGASGRRDGQARGAKAA